MQLSKYKLGGFTLIEVLVALFIFAILMTAAASIFANAFNGFRNTRSIQKDLENAQFVMSILSKELRTSTIVDPNGSTLSTTNIQFYDHSQGRCFRYSIQDGQIQAAGVPVSDVAACNSLSIGILRPVSTGTVTGHFAVVPSQISPKRVGKVTMTLRIEEGPNHHADIQTTVSLRDYGEDGSDL